MIIANALWSKDPTPSTSSRARVPRVLGEPLARHHRPHYVHRQPLRGRPLTPLTAVRPSDNCTLIGKSSGSLSYGQPERYRSMYLLLLAIPRGARQTLPDSLLHLIVSGHNAGYKDGAAEAIWVVQVSSCGKRHGGLRRPQAGQRLTMTAPARGGVRIGPPDGELPVDGDGFLARDQDSPASPERPGGSTCCQRGAIADRKLAALIPACFLADFQHSPHRRP
jgi:hypothetical protein